jgi:hypothetical protein
MSFLVLSCLATVPKSEPSHVWQTQPAARPAARTVLVRATKPDTGAKEPKRRFTVGKETTHVTGPVGKDGYIDYAAALNQRMRQGVTPDNNAAVLLWKALGPHPEGGKTSPEIFRWLGMEAPLEGGDYYIDLSKYVKEHVKDADQRTDILEHQEYRAMLRPWTPQQYPQLAAWLKANDKPLALVVEATKRTRYFSPLVPRRVGSGSSGLIGALLPAAQKCRALGNALAARAMLRVGLGAHDLAWQDLLACHRLGRLVGRGPTLIEGLIGIALETIASNADLAYLEFARPTARRLDRCLRDLQNLPPPAAMADKVDLTERFTFLDIVMMIDRGGNHIVRDLESLAGGKSAKAVDPQSQRILKNIDWDPALRNANRWYDRIVTAMRARDRAARVRLLNAIETDVKALKKKLVDSGKLNQALLDDKLAPAVRGKALGDILICLLLPAVPKVHTAADRSGQIHDNLRLAFALARYQRDHGRFPRKLETLAPKYLTKIPSDIFSGKALVYVPSAGGYLLYSVGANGKDDGGRGYDDEPPGDDLSVRVPLPPLRRKD